MNNESNTQKLCPHCNNVIHRITKRYMVHPTKEEYICYHCGEVFVIEQKSKDETQSKDI